MSEQAENIWEALVVCRQEVSAGHLLEVCLSFSTATKSWSYWLEFFGLLLSRWRQIGALLLFPSARKSRATPVACGVVSTAVEKHFAGSSLIFGQAAVSCSPAHLTHFGVEWQHLYAWPYCCHRWHCPGPACLWSDSAVATVDGRWPTQGEAVASFVLFSAQTSSPCRCRSSLTYTTFSDRQTPLLTSAAVG